MAESVSFVFRIQFLIGMRAYGYRFAEFIFNGFGDFLQVDGTGGGGGRLNHAGAQVDGVNIPVQIISLFHNQGQLGHHQPGTVPAAAHGGDSNLIVILGKFPVLLFRLP